jgi:hypothetical protein
MNETDLDGRLAELRDAAERLRALPGDAPADEAAALVERCAELAAEVAGELERRYRDARAEPAPGQERLL